LPDLQALCNIGTGIGANLQHQSRADKMGQLHIIKQGAQFEIEGSAIRAEEGVYLFV